MRLATAFREDAADTVRPVRARPPTPALAISKLQPGNPLVWLARFTAAYASPGTNRAIDIEDQDGANFFTCVHILSNGDLDVASIAAWVTAHSVITIKIPKLYDQTGNGVHVTQATLASMPTLVLRTPTLLLFSRQPIPNNLEIAQALSSVYQRTGTSLGIISGFAGVGPLGANAATVGLYQPSGGMTFFRSCRSRCSGNRKRIDWNGLR
jgi:hypothetical protein